MKPLSSRLTHTGAALFLLLCLSPANAAASTEETPLTPIIWHPPESFDTSLNSHGLGLKRLKGVTHEVIYAPQASNAHITGTYESVDHGLYNHHTLAYFPENVVAVTWENHSIDEGGPGSRRLSRTGIFTENGSFIEWLPDIIEIASTPVAVNRRTPYASIPSPDAEHRYASTSIAVIDNQLRVITTLSMGYGWTDEYAYKTMAGNGGIIPDERFSPNRQGNYNYDLVWKPGPSYYRLWQIQDSVLFPSSSLYADKDPPSSLALTPTKTLTLANPNAPYNSALAYSSADTSLKEQFSRKLPITRGAKGWSHGKSVAANGKNGLAHMAQFQRPDGLWTIIRDNLEDEGYYYAATAAAEDTYPPAVETNLYGYVMPDAGELPDGRTWILVNGRDRYEFFLTLSEDGINFDRTWRILTIKQNATAAFGKSGLGGPQYPNTHLVGDTLWIFYSIAKEQIGATRIPLAAFDTAPITLIEETFPDQSRTHQNPPDSLAWYSSSANPSTVTVSPPSVTGSNSLTLTLKSNEVHHAVAHFPPVFLATGDVLTLSFDISLPSVLGNNDDAIRFGLFNCTNPANRFTVDGPSTSVLENTAAGYAVKLNPRNNALAKAFIQKRITSSATPFITHNQGYRELASNYLEETRLETEQTYHIEFELTRANATATRALLQISGGNLAYPREYEYTDTSTEDSTHIFDTIAFSSFYNPSTGGPPILHFSNITLKHLPLAPRPKILDHPQSILQAAGSSVTLSVTASGETLSYQWHKDNKPIPGATNSTLILHPLSADDTATYTCTITNSREATATSLPAKVNVITLPDQLLIYALTDSYEITSDGSLTTKGNLDYLPKITQNSNTANISFTPHRKDLTYTLQSSQDLVTWTDIYTLSPEETGTSYEHPLPSSESSRQFFRLKITPRD